MKIKNILSVLILITTTLFNNNLSAAANCIGHDGSTRVTMEIKEIVRDKLKNGTICSNGGPLYKSRNYKIEVLDKSGNEISSDSEGNTFTINLGIKGPITCTTTKGLAPNSEFTIKANDDATGEYEIFAIMGFDQAWMSDAVEEAPCQTKFKGQVFKFKFVKTLRTNYYSEIRNTGTSTTNGATFTATAEAKTATGLKQEAYVGNNWYYGVKTMPENLFSGTVKSQVKVNLDFNVAAVIAEDLSDEIKSASTSLSVDFGIASISHTFSGVGSGGTAEVVMGRFMKINNEALKSFGKAAFSNRDKVQIKVYLQPLSNHTFQHSQSDSVTESAISSYTVGQITYELQAGVSVGAMNNFTSHAKTFVKSSSVSITNLEVSHAAYKFAIQ